MKEYNVMSEGGTYYAEGFKSIRKAKKALKEIIKAEESYDIYRPDGYYKIVEREVGPWRIVKEKSK
jgi:hypothetical protein